MTSRPDITFLDQARNEGELKTSFYGPILDNSAEAPGRGAMTELTISAGSVTPPAQASRQFSVDTELDAATDDLANIDQTNSEDGAWLLIRNDTDGRAVVVKHGAGGTGQILLADSQDLTLDDTAKSLLLRREGTTWVEIGRFLGAGSYARKQATVEPETAARTFTADDDGKLILGDVSGGAFTFTLPAVADVPNGYSVTVKKTDTSTDVLTLDGSGAETIDGRTDIKLVSQYDRVKVVSDGTSWHIEELRASFASAAQTITSAALRTLAHGLGVEPDWVNFVLQCTTAENGYSVGNRILVSMVDNSSAATSRANSVTVDATNIAVRFTDQAIAFVGANKTTGALAGLTNANWDLYVKAGVA